MSEIKSHKDNPNQLGAPVATHSPADNEHRSA
jgi:hypothetical protein